MVFAAWVGVCCGKTAGEVAAGEGVLDRKGVDERGFGDAAPAGEDFVGVEGGKGVRGGVHFWWVCGDAVGLRVGVDSLIGVRYLGRRDGRAWGWNWGEWSVVWCFRVVKRL